MLRFIQLTFFFIKKRPIACNWDRCCHLALCLWLILFHLKRWSGNSSKWQLIKMATHRMPIGMATHRMPFRGGNSSKKFTHKSPTFDELPPQWQLTECPLRWQLTKCPLEVPFTESTINHSFIQYFVHSVSCHSVKGVSI